MSDGDAGVARVLVKYLIPVYELPRVQLAEALISAQFDYQQLDRNDRSHTHRLNSTAVEVRHRGDRQRLRRDVDSPLRERR